MLHIHFGAGRLGLGLVCPYMQLPHSELFLLNRASSGSKPTGGTALHPARRNGLLSHHSRQEYVIASPGKDLQPRERIRYDGFHTYADDNVSPILSDIFSQSLARREGITVTASVLSLENYVPVIAAINQLAAAKDKAEPGSTGNIYLVACENTVGAHQVWKAHADAGNISDASHRHVRCVHALVDRVCVELEEALIDGEPTVVVRAEEYGSLKLEVRPDIDELPRLLEGSTVHFSHHLEVEKDIKSWLLNGSHWAIALTAFRESNGDASLRLNDFINSTENHYLYATEVLTEMRDGIEALLRSDPKYASFVRDVDVTAYLDGAACSILRRFQANDDTITRILARFRQPTSDQVCTVQSFAERFLARVDGPMQAYKAAKGTSPSSLSEGIFNLFRLQASGTYVDSGEPERLKAA